MMGIMRYLLIFLFSIFLTFIPSGILFSQETIIKWRYPATGRITAVIPGDQGKRIYFLCGDRSLNALTITGTPLWKSLLGEKPGTFLREGPDGTVYGLSENNTLFAVNPRGRIIWKRDDLGTPAGDPLISKTGIIYFLSNSGILTALTPSGKIQWKLSTGSKPGVETILLPGGFFIKQVSSSKIQGFSLVGAFLWEKDFTGPIRKIVSAGKGFLIQDSSGIINYCTYPGKIEKASAFSQRNELLENAYFFNNRFYFITSSGKLYRTETGTAEPDSAKSNMTKILTISSGGTVTGYDRTGSIIIFSSNNAEKKIKVKGTGITCGEYIDEEKENYLYALCGEDWVVSVISLPRNNDEEEIQALQSYIEQEGDLKNSVSFNDWYLQYLVESLDEKDKTEALEEIRSLLSSPENGETFMKARYLALDLASQGVLNPLQVRGKVMNNFPQIRSQAVLLISRGGDFSTREFLIRLARHEFDQYALSIEIYALGEVKSDTDGKTGALFLEIIKGQTPAKADDRIADTIIDAIAKISNYHGSIDEDSMDALIHIFQGPFSKKVRSKALDALQGIGK